MCLLLTMVFVGPRAAIALYWLFYPARWEVAFDSFLVGFAGFLLAPWTTLAYVLAAPQGVDGWDYLVMALAVLLDIASWAGGGRKGADRYQQAYSGTGTPYKI